MCFPNIDMNYQNIRNQFYRAIEWVKEDWKREGQAPGIPTSRIGQIVFYGLLATCFYVSLYAMAKDAEKKQN